MNHYKVGLGGLGTGGLGPGLDNGDLYILNLDFTIHIWALLLMNFYFPVCIQEHKQK